MLPRIEQVSIRQGDTDEVPDAIGRFASRGATVGGAVARLASRELIKEILKRLAAQLGSACEDLSWEEGGVTGRGLADDFIPLSEIPVRLASRQTNSVWR
jgi:carbon-monoxide dehydrogenase large subunit